jgi:hypothetical protein
MSSTSQLGVEVLAASTGATHRHEPSRRLLTFVEECDTRLIWL